MTKKDELKAEAQEIAKDASLISDELKSPITSTQTEEKPTIELSVEKNKSNPTSNNIKNSKFDEDKDDELDFKIFKKFLSDF